MRTEEGKKKKKERQRTQSLAPLCHQKFNICEWQCETGSTFCFVPRRKEAKVGTAAESGTLSQGIPSRAWHCSLPHGSSATGDAPGPCPAFSTASQGAGTQHEELEWCSSEWSEVVAEIKSSRKKWYCAHLELQIIVPCCMLGAAGSLCRTVQRT